MSIIVPIRDGMPKQRDSEWYLFIGPKGTLPKDHPPLERGKRGKVLLAIQQVWVEIHSDKLWVVRSLRKVRNTSYPHDVELTPYCKDHYQRILAEASLRQTMMVWEDAIKFRINLNMKLDYAAENDSRSPFKGPKAATSARRFFGIDADGNRTD